MIIIEIVFLLGIIAGVFIICHSVYRYFIAKINLKAMAICQLDDALKENSRHQLENILIIYGEVLDKKIKESIRYRIDELLIDEPSKGNYESLGRVR